MDYRKLFFKHKTMDDILKSIEGELPDLCLDEATFWYGNGELIVSPVDSDESIVYVVDTYGDKQYLVEY